MEDFSNEKMKNSDKRNQEWAERNSSKILAKEKYVIKSQKTPEAVKKPHQLFTKE